MDKIQIKINASEERGILHDSRKDIRTLSKAINLLIDKLNEIIEEINKNKT